jgi:transcription elongation factor GreA
MRLPTRKSEILRQSNASDGPIYMTKVGIDKLKKRIEQIKSEIPSARDEVRRTQEMGDLSENAAYQAAKYHLRKLDGDLIRLNEDLKRIVQIDDISTSDNVRIGSTVILTTKTGEVTYQIVGERESDPKHGRISNLSPIGEKLMGLKVGDRIKINGEVNYLIKEIK